MKSITEQRDLCVQTVPLFAQLPLEQLTAIEALVKHKHFAQGETLYLPGSQTQALYIIHQGQVNIARGNASGREQLLRVIGPGEFAGDQALFAATPHTTSAVAVAPVTACVLYQQDFKQLLQTSPTLSFALLQEQATRITALEKQTTLLATASVAGRLAQYLLTQQNTVGAQFKLPLKKKDLAEYLGTTPETVSRQLKRFEDTGLISQPGPRQIVILNAQGLAAIE